jgi:hypothetical protein
MHKDSNRTFYVALDGSDSNPGTQEEPLSTLEGARNAIRQMINESGLPADGVIVYMREGAYRLTETFRLEAQDSGTVDRPIVYTSFPGEEVRFVGGVDLPANRFGPVTESAICDRLQERARDHVLQIDLKALGITDYGKIAPGGFRISKDVTEATPELFFAGKTMMLARYPNDNYVKIAGVIDPGGNPREFELDEAKMAEENVKGAKFEYADPRPGTWLNTGDVWMYGYWYWDWADGNLRIQSIDIANKRILTETASFYSIRSGQRYFYYNVLEELDSPGEWYLDRGTGMLYLYPPSPITEGSVQLSLLKDPMVHLDGVSHVSFSKLTFEVSRGSGIHIVGGSHNVIAGCAMRRLAGFAVIVGENTTTGTNAGTHHGIVSCNICDTGIGGISLGGGDRQTLAPGGNYARNNDIFNYSRLKLTYSAAVQLNGVGNIAANNYIHDAPHVGILIYGNDHVVEYNDIYNVLMETGDAGAIYMGRDWTEQGNVIRYNYIHKIYNDASELHIGIYLDDMASGTTIYGNILHDIDLAVMIGGGRNNDMVNNLILSCQRSLQLDDRAMPDCWAAYHVEEGQVMQRRLQAMPYNEESWRTKYPRLLTIWQDAPGSPKYNNISRNVLSRTGTTSYGQQSLHEDTMAIVPTAREFGTIEHNWVTDTDLLFADENSGNFSLQDESPVFREVPGFEAIPFERIGLYRDEYRRKGERL